MPRRTLDIDIPAKFGGLFEPPQRYRFKAFHGGRGSGKSRNCASALLVKGLSRPLRWLCCREIQKSIASSVKQLLDDEIGRMGLGDFYTSTDKVIRSAIGGSIIFAGLRNNPDSIKSIEGLNGAWVEEAHSISQTSLDLLTPTVRSGSTEIWFTWNRRHASDPVDNLFLGGEPPPRSLVEKVDWRDNPWFPDDLREEMEWMKRRDRDKWLHVWEGHLLKRSEALVFRNWEEGDLDDDVELEGAEPLLGGDWGFSRDPSVLVEAYILGRTLYFRDEAWKVGCEIDELPSLFAGSDPLERWGNARQHPGIAAARHHRITADSSRPDTVSYMRRHGFDIRGAVKGAGSVEDGIEFMKSFDIVVHPRCRHVIDELSTYSYKVDRDTDEVLSVLEDKNNHTIDSCRYALEGARRRRAHGIIVGPEAVDLGDELPF